MSVFFQANPHFPRVAFCIYARGGNQLDRLPGQVDLIDRLLTKGTKNRSAEAIAIALDSTSLELDVDTKRDYSVVYGTVLPEDLEPSFELINELLHESTLAELPREAAKLQGEITMELDSPRAKASDQLMRAVFGSSAYATVGSLILEQLEPITQDAAGLEALYHQAYQPSNYLISAAGNVDEAEFKALLNRTVLAPKAAQPVSSAPPAQNLPALKLTEDQVVSFARDDSNQMNLFRAFLAPPATHEDVVPLTLLNTILGAGGLSSRLFVELRDKQGLAYNVRSGLELYQHCGLLTLYIGTEPKNTSRSLQGFQQELDKLLNTPVGEQELADAKKNWLGRQALRLETASQQAHYTGANAVLGRSPEVLKHLPEKIQAVTAAELQRVAQTYLSQPSVVSAVGPAGSLPQSIVGEVALQSV